MSEEPIWVTVAAPHAAQAASDAVRAHGGRVMRVVPGSVPGRWQVQLGDVAGSPELDATRVERLADPVPLLAPVRAEPAPVSRTRLATAGRSRAAKPAALIGVAVCAALLIALAMGQRSSAAQWRDRARATETELELQRALSVDLLESLTESEADVRRLQRDVARLAAKVAEVDDEAQSDQ